MPSTELHYTLRYVEKHGRDLSNPWSVRQVAIYQQVNFGRCFACWIIIHANKLLQDNLSKTMHKETPNFDSHEVLLRSIFSRHLIIVASAVQNWNAYLDYLSSEFKKTVRGTPLSVSPLEAL
jgi:hypothetical protein